MNKIHFVKRNLLFLLALLVLISSNLVLQKIGLLGTNYEVLAKTIMHKCNQAEGSKEGCYSSEFLKIAEKSGPKFSFDVLFVLQKIDTSAQGCHFIAHGIGHGTYNRDPANWQVAIQNMNPSCSYGAIHGVMEGYIDNLHDRHLTREVVPQLCGDKPRADCNHIVGHLLLVETDGDINKALALCSVFKNKPIQQHFCDTGVFMEYQTAVNLVEHGLASKEWLNWAARVGELEKICRSYQGEPAIACWKEITHAALVKFKYDPQKIFDFCNMAQVTQGSKECKEHAIGIMAAHNRFDLDHLKSMCAISQKDPNFQNDCYGHLVASMLATLPQELSRANDFCISLDAIYQPSCLAQVKYAGNKTHIDD